MKLRIFTAVLLVLCALFTSALAYTDMTSVSPETVAPYFPDYTLISGVDEGNTLLLHMQKPSGETVFIGGSQSESGEWSFAESTPLPEGAFLGNENLYDELVVPTSGYAFSIRFAPFSNGTWGIVALTYGSDEPVRFGRNWISYLSYDLTYIGDHPWSDITSIDWSTLPSTYDQAVEKANFNRWGVVKAYTAMLYRKPETTSATNGKYVQGAPVCVREFRDGYARVLIGQTEGWMLVTDLALHIEMADVVSMSTAFLVDEQTFIYAEPNETSAVRIWDESYTSIYVLATKSDNWAHIWIPAADIYGYVRQDAYSFGDG